MTDTRVKSIDRQGLRLHPLPLRIMHWTNAVAMIIMIGSGWKIYNDEVLFGRLHFPDWITIGGEQQGALQWHFLGMWILVLNGLAYLWNYVRSLPANAVSDPLSATDRRHS